MTELFNNDVTVKISEKGAELKSLKISGKEYIWQSDKEIWNASAPLLFPICSSLKDDEYIYGGNTYHLEKHGFACEKKFCVEEKKDNKAIFVLKSDASDKSVYPFDYELRVTYVLENARLYIKYEVKNTSKETMYFSIGAHEGYYLPLGLENYQIEFPQNETLYSYSVKGNVLTGSKKLILKDSNTLPLKYGYFSEDALIFKDLKSRSAIIKTNKGEPVIKVTFEGFDYFLVWTKPKADFVCLEPWCGITDNADHDKDITKKEGINAIKPGDTFVRKHIIEIF